MRVVKIGPFWMEWLEETLDLMCEIGEAIEKEPEGYKIFVRLEKAWRSAGEVVFCSEGGK